MTTRTAAARPLRSLGATRREPGPALTDAFLARHVRQLSWGERLDVLDAWSQVLDGLYAHLPLKRALYGFDPIRALERLRQQVPALTDLQFHREVHGLVNRLRDAHTQYRGPEVPDASVVALPFLVEDCGPAERPEYLVTKIATPEVDDARFVPGVRLEYWNGIPFDRAVDLHAERETGGRPDARRARALESLTVRALSGGPPPDELWVIVGYRDLGGRPREVRLPWRCYAPGRVSAAAEQRRSRARRAIDDAAETVRRAKKMLFNDRAWGAELRERGRGAGAPALDDFATARPVDAGGRKVGHLRLWSFDVDDDVAFVDGVARMLARLPQDGLIVDLRHNPGGLIWAAERLLQLFTPGAVRPTRFAMRTTPETLAIAEAATNRGDLGPWAESLATAARTGEPYSAHLPITSLEQCNDVGQRYGGPVVVVVDANTYSSGDLFTAGVVDNGIGTVVCVGEATGAGGANVWGHADVQAALRAAGRRTPDLPEDVGLSVAIRRAVRSGDADGRLIEDDGVVGQPYAMTRDDVLHGNRDLLAHCAAILAASPRTKLKVLRAAGAYRLVSRGLDRIDVFADGQPLRSSLRPKGRKAPQVRVPARTRSLEVVGYEGTTLRQRRLVDMRTPGPPRELAREAVRADVTPGARPRRPRPGTGTRPSRRRSS